MLRKKIAISLSLAACLLLSAGGTAMPVFAEGTTQSAVSEAAVSGSSAAMEVLSEASPAEAKVAVPAPAEKDTGSGDSGTYSETPVEEAYPAVDEKAVAEAAAEAASVQNTDVRDSIVTIVTGYEHTDGSFDPWVKGYGTLVSKDCILIPRNLATIEQDSQLYRSILSKNYGDTSFSRLDAYQKYGIDLRKYSTVMKNVHTYVMDGEKMIEATVSTIADGDSFSLLIPLERINSKPPAIISEQRLKKDDVVYAVGTEKEEVQDRMDFFGRMSTISGTRKSQSSEYVEFKGAFRALNPGCPLVDINEHMVGLITDGSAGSGSAVDIRSVERVLDAANVGYTTTALLQKEGETEDSEMTADRLTAMVESASRIDTSSCTEQSVQNLQAAIESVNKVLADTNASQNRLAKAAAVLDKAVNGLEMIDRSSKYNQMIGIAVMLVIILVAVFIAIRVMMKNKGKEKWEVEEEREAKKEQRKEARKQKKKKCGKSTDSGNSGAGNNGAGNSGESETGVLRRTMAEGFDDDGEGETGVLKQKQSPVLILKGVNDGKLITINKDKFIIGKSADGTDYRVFNDNVSRRHCRITRSNGEYIIEDLGSTNGTYIDGLRLDPNEESRLHNGQELMLADETFTVQVK